MPLKSAPAGHYRRQPLATVLKATDEVQENQNGCTHSPPIAAWGMGKQNVPCLKNGKTSFAGSLHLAIKRPAKALKSWF